MQPEYNQLNKQIDSLLDGKSPFSRNNPASSSQDMATLGTAIRLATLRAGACKPDPRFVERLRLRVLVESSS